MVIINRLIFKRQIHISVTSLCNCSISSCIWLMVGFFEVFAKIGYSSRYPCLNNGIFCYQVTDRIVEKFSFLYKLLLTFFFFCSDFNTDICPCQNHILYRYSGESRLLARINNGLFLCPTNACLINRGGCLSPITFNPAFRTVCSVWF